MTGSENVGSTVWRSTIRWEQTLRRSRSLCPDPPHNPDLCTHSTLALIQRGRLAIFTLQIALERISFPQWAAQIVKDNTGCGAGLVGGGPFGGGALVALFHLAELTYAHTAL